MATMDEPGIGDEAPEAFGRHSVLLVSLIVLLVLLPVSSLASVGGIRFSTLLCLVLIAAVLVSSGHRWILFVAIALGSASIGGLAWAEIAGSAAVRLFAHGSGLALLVLTTSLMLSGLVRARTVSRDVLVGAVCVYLLIGLCFAMAFLLLVAVAPGSLLDAGVPIERAATSSGTHATTLLYFSFVTLTTLGYGDVTPESELAQMLTVAEAIIGQLYVAIFIARLLSLYLIRAPGEAGTP